MEPGNVSRNPKTRILLADDSPESLRIWSAILTPRFDIVAVAGNGRSALEMIVQLKPAVAVLDFEMPHGTGIDVLRHLATRVEKTAVVICSVDCSTELISTAREFGALGFVAKPYCARDLAAAVEAASRRLPFFPRPHARDAKPHPRARKRLVHHSQALTLGL